ncbi:MAG: thioredoxin family protein [Candidatus Kryptonium sp.]
MRKILSISIALLLLLNSCASRKYSIVERGNTKIIIGEFPIKLLEDKSFGWYNDGYSKYSIDDVESFNVIKSKANKFDVLIFLGTWCPDSREHVPKFMRIMDEAGVSRKHIKVIGLDRDKKLNGLTDKYNITRVPTFIFFENKREIGRIIEHPQETLIKHIAKILSQVK